MPALHVVTDDRVLARAGWPEQARAVLEAGGRRVALHVRGPGLGGRRLHDLAAALVEPARGAGATLIVNDRVDVAMAVGADGVQLGERSLPVAQTRRVVGERVLVGASVHGAERARVAEAEGADYLLVGTVFATASHPDRPGGGPELVRAVADAVELPLLAIGGVTPARVGAVLAAGAGGVAVLSGIWDAEDRAGAVDAYLRALTGR